MIAEVVYYTCTKNCCGVSGQAGLCCTVSERDWILGPVKDTERFLKDLSRLKGRAVAYNEVFVDFEEGSRMFPEKSVWQSKRNYPALRVHQDRSRGYPCTMLSEDNSLCSVHAIKPEICHEYYCEHLKRIDDFLDGNL